MYCLYVSVACCTAEATWNIQMMKNGDASLARGHLIKSENICVGRCERPTQQRRPLVSDAENVISASWMSMASAEKQRLMPNLPYESVELKLFHEPHSTNRTRIRRTFPSQSHTAILIDSQHKSRDLNNRTLHNFVLMSEQKTVGIFSIFGHDTWH